MKEIDLTERECHALFALIDVELRVGGRPPCGDGDSLTRTEVELLWCKLRPEPKLKDAHYARARVS